jgi:two-component system, OmpR family, sensor kinase
VSAALLAAVAVVLAAMMLYSRRSARRAAEAQQRMAALHAELGREHNRIERQAGLQREWLAVLAHELRSPVSAVTGYAELLAEGAVGNLDARAGDVVARIGQAADQLLRLIEAIEDMGAERSTSHEDVRLASARLLLLAAVEAARADAESRSVALVAGDGDAPLATRHDQALRTIQLALGAALKVSAGGTLHIDIADADPVTLVIAGSRLDPLRDDPDHVHDEPGLRLTGAALRLGLARRTARNVDGTVTLHGTPGGVELRVTLPSLALRSSIDGAEEIP